MGQRLRCVFRCLSRCLHCRLLRGELLQHRLLLFLGERTDRGELLGHLGRVGVHALEALDLSLELLGRLLAQLELGDLLAVLLDFLRELAAEPGVDLSELLARSPDFQRFHPTSVMETPGSVFGM